MDSKQQKTVWLLGLLLILVTFMSLGLGAFYIPPIDILEIIGYKLGLVNLDHEVLAQDVLLQIRLPRVIMGILVGAGLGVSGAAIQGVFRNPLADPGLLGMSSGASLFAVFVIALETFLANQLNEIVGDYLLAIAAFTGAALTAWLVFQLSKKNGQAQVKTMLLAGIAINAFAGALTGLLTYMSSEQQLRTITFWMLGGLGSATWDNVLIIFPFMLMPIVILPFFGKSLNLFSLGEYQANMLGVQIDSLKRLVILLSTLAVGSSVAFCGIIGFVGLIVPHMIRLIAGADNRYVLWGSVFFGALVLTLSDVISRVIIAPIELPLGVITALLGTPVFLYILLKEK